MNILTTSQPIGVTIRYVSTIVTTALTVIGMLNWLTPEQVQELTDAMPSLFEAVTGLITILVPVYAIITKSHSDKAAEAAKVIDKKVPPQEPVLIKTPKGEADIVVSAK